MHKAIKVGIFLCISFTFLLIFRIDNVRADCFRIIGSDNSEKYIEATESEANKYKMVGAKKIEKVSDFYCREIVQVDDNNVVKNFDSNLLTCGNGLLTDIPPDIPKVVHIVYLVIQILIPVLLVIFGSLDLMKGVYAQKEDEIKKGQQTFIKRLITGVIVFFIFAIVKLVISFAADDEKSRILNCASCFINNNGDCVVQT